MTKTWKPIVAGILELILCLVGVGYLIAASVGYKSLLALVWLPLAILPLVGGVCALRRRMWWVAFIVSVLSFPFGLPAIILLALSKQEFKS